MTVNPLREDLDHILAHTEGLWEELRGQRLFITGGTGFFGCWLLESFAWANDRLGLNAEVVVLTRNFEAFARKAPHLAGYPAISFHIGDVRSFDFPAGAFTHVIHAATESSTRLNQQDPLAMFDSIVGGTRRVLDFAVACGAKNFLFTSSGAVYGRQPPDLTHIPEDYVGSPDTMDPASAYGEGKRAAELLCAIYQHRYGFQVKIARCFAFVGPYLPLDAHFAIGNFIRDALSGGPIKVSGDGTSFRSYLYAADMTVWLWKILLVGDSLKVYNTGSNAEMTILDVARCVAKECGLNESAQIEIQAKAGQRVQRYVPSIERGQRDLGLEVGLSLGDAVRRTFRYYADKL